MKRISKLNLGANITGEGLYDKEVISLLRKNKDPFPLLRAMIPELGIDYETVEFNQNKKENLEVQKIIFFFFV